MEDCETNSAEKPLSKDERIWDNHYLSIEKNIQDDSV